MSTTYINSYENDICNINMLEQVEANNSIGFQILDPVTLTALLGTKISLEDISTKFELPLSLLYYCTDLWKIDITKLHNQAIEKAKLLIDGPDDERITPYEATVLKACEDIGWNYEKFKNSYKAFLANRQRSFNTDTVRPSSVRNIQETQQCDITLIQYFILWTEAGRESFHKIGKSKLETDSEGSTALQVCRKDHDKHYFLENCFIGEQGENIREAMARTSIGKSKKSVGICIGGAQFKSRSEAKMSLDKSEYWISSREGDYKQGIFRLDEPMKILRESLSTIKNN